VIAMDNAMHRGNTWLPIATALIGVMNYGYSAGLARALSSTAYSVFAGGQALLLLCGTVAAASTPWFLAHGVAQAPHDAHRRRYLLSFSSLLAIGQGIAAGLSVVFVASRFASGWVLPILAVAALAIFFAPVAVGYLQGFERFGSIALLLVGEVVVKLGVGLLLVRSGKGAAGALAGFAAGALMMSISGLVVVRHDLRLSLASLRYWARWGRVAWFAGVQALLALLLNLDLLLVSLLLNPGGGLARYQLGSFLSRGPLFLSMAVSIAAFPRLSAGSYCSASTLRASVDLLLSLALPLSLLAATIPPPLLGSMFPSDYRGVADLLPYVSATQLLISVVYLLATAHQAELRFVSLIRVLIPALLVHGAAVLTGAALAGVRGAAVGALVGSSCAVTMLLIISVRRWPGLLRPSGRTVVWVLLSCPLLFLRTNTRVWIAFAVLSVLLVGWTLLSPHVRRGAPCGGSLRAITSDPEKLGLDARVWRGTCGRSWKAIHDRERDP
jgi:O-antigen/teichoic acid export membrane protein